MRESHLVTRWVTVQTPRGPVKYNTTTAWYRGWDSVIGYPIFSHVYWNHEFDRDIEKGLLNPLENMEDAFLIQECLEDWETLPDCTQEQEILKAKHEEQYALLLCEEDNIIAVLESDWKVAA